jgi:peptide/nickel transport system permease protein
MSAGSGRASAAGQAGLRTRPRGWRADYQPDRRRAWYRLLLRSPLAVASLVFVGTVVLCALFAPLVAPEDPTFIDPAVRLREPSRAHWLGTDDLGRDVFSRLLHGGRVSLLVGASVTLASAGLGSLLGLLAGYYRRLDGPIMRVMDGFMAFPGVLLAIAVVISLGARLGSVILALVLVYLPVVARLVRGTTLTIRTLPYVEGARCAGLRDRTILRRYVLANAVSPLIVQCTFVIAYAILAESSLSFLGASVNPETPTWGNMLRDGQRLLGSAWWMAVAPGVTLFLTVLALTLLGDALRDALDPRARERREDAVVR